MLRTFRAIALLTLLAAQPPTSALADAPTKDEVVTLVREAIGFYRTHGRHHALAELNRRDGRFAQGEDYVDVHDLQGVCRAQPMEPELVGTSRMLEVDANGKYWIRDLVEAAGRSSAGWTRYLHVNPVTHKLQDKLSYWQVYDGLVFKAGLYFD
jgi:signal transduction histidine kinase